MSRDVNVGAELDHLHERRLSLAADDLRPIPSAAVGQVWHEEAHLLDYVRTLYKRRWIALTALMLVFAFGAVRTYTTTPAYEATTRLQIENENPNVVSFKEVIQLDRQEAAYLQTQLNILQSRALALRTVRALAAAGVVENVPERPDIRFGRRASQQIASTAAASTRSESRATAPSVSSPVALGSLAETETERSAVDALLGRIAVSPIRNSRLVDVKFRSGDNEYAAKAVNIHARQYIEQNLEFKYLSSRDASDWLTKQLAAQRTRVEDAELALQRYREQHDAVSLEERQNIVVQKLADLNAAVTRAKTERLQKEALYNQVRQAQSDRSALDAIPAVLGNAFIQQLKTDLAQHQRRLAELSETLGEKHPDHRTVKNVVETTERRLLGELGRVVESLRNEYLAAQAQERSLVEALDQQKSEALQLNRKGIEYGVLARDAESNRQMYESLMQRVKETGISGELKTSNIRVIDSAEIPRRPFQPNRPLDLAVALFGGVFLGIGLAFFTEYLDSRIKTPEEIRTHLGVPCVGFLPAVKSDAVAAGQLLINQAMPAAFSESCRSLRTNILFSSTNPGIRSVLVTSAAPSEGKTIVAANLAISLAQAGSRVLLIDGDLRRPRMHDVFDLPQSPGLSNIMVGAAKPSEAVRKTAVPGLFLLAAGQTPPNPAEIVGSQRFAEFTASLNGHFDWFVIDSPPVLAVTDACLMAQCVSGVLLTIGAEMTTRKAVQTALEQLDLARARVIGAVLNKVQIQRNAFYYSSRYRADYAQYYK
jgi:succinoglycan biosynthesis transport protein ExoP